MVLPWQNTEKESTTIILTCTLPFISWMHITPCVALRSKIVLCFITWSLVCKLRRETTNHVSYKLSIDCLYIQLILMDLPYLECDKVLGSCISPIFLTLSGLSPFWWRVFKPCIVNIPVVATGYIMVMWKCAQSACRVRDRHTASGVSSSGEFGH